MVVQLAAAVAARALATRGAATAGARAAGGAATEGGATAGTRAPAQPRPQYPQQQAQPRQQEQQKKRQRINILDVILMISMALAFDGLQFVLELIPVAGIIFGWGVSIFSFIVFGIWFAVCGVNYLDRNGAVKMITVIASVCTEMVPYISMIPAITFGVAALILITRDEDSEHGGLLSMLTTRSSNRWKSLSDKEQNGTEKERAEARSEKTAARQRAEALTQRDTTRNPERIGGLDYGYERSKQSRLVDGVRKLSGTEDYSSPTLKEYYRKQVASQDASNNEDGEQGV